MNVLGLISQLIGIETLRLTKYATHRDQLRLYQFLIGLLDDYDPIRGQLLHSLLLFLLIQLSIS
jgi:hypothetical protein